MVKDKAKTGKNATIITLVVVALVLIVGVLIYAVVDKMSTVNVSESQTNVSVVKDQEFTITLTSNASTGYSWTLDETYNSDIVEFIGSEYVTSDSNLTGAAGNEIWTFKAKNTGSTELNFRYIRAWEGDSSQVDSQTFTVTVN